MKEAEKNSDRIVNESLSKARKIALEIEELKKQSKVFRTRFKMLIEAQLDLLSNDDWDHLLQYELDSTELKSMEEEDSLALTFYNKRNIILKNSLYHNIR